MSRAAVTVSAHMVPLSQLEVLVVDCQATAAAPRGHLLEIGWAGSGSAKTQCRLIALPRHERIPPAVTRITGITDSMARDGIGAAAAWRDLLEAAGTLPQQPAPAVAHFARFEKPFLRSLAGDSPAPLDLVCTHDIARRLLPDLPRCSLRALTGYFGRAVAPLRRSADHVEATAFLWRELVRLLDGEGISTWRALQHWLTAPPHAAACGRRVWPMPREARLSLPHAPGVYRMLRSNGDVLYVGKAASLHDRVNSYFGKQHRVPERMLEMLSQARAISCDVTPTVLEAALLEPDEIKRHHPPYNIALTADERHVWFAPADLSERNSLVSPRCSTGPFPSPEMLDQFGALARGSRAALGDGRWAPDAAAFDAGYARLCAAHEELSRGNGSPQSRLLRLGTRLWREGRRDQADELDAAAHLPLFASTSEQVQSALERLAIRAALALRRAGWFTRLVDASLVWAEPGVEGKRMLMIENGDITLRTSAGSDAVPPIPPGYARPLIERRRAFTVARFDRLRVLTTELKRLAAEDGASVAVRFGVAPPLAGARFARVLSWL